MMLKYCEIANCKSARERTQTRKQALKTKNTMLDKIFIIKLIKIRFLKHHLAIAQNF